MKRLKRKMHSVFQTPLEKVVGFSVSEKTYDKLSLSEQIVLDLKIEGITNRDIAMLLGVRPDDIVRMLTIIRTKLVNSELQFHLEIKTHYQKQKEIVLDEATFHDGYIIQDVLVEKYEPEAQ